MTDPDEYDDELAAIGDDLRDRDDFEDHSDRMANRWADGDDR